MEQKINWDKNWKVVFIFAVLLWLLYVLTRYAMGSLYTPEWAARNIYWLCASIIFFPTFWGKFRFSVTAFAGYILGLAAGEVLGGFRRNVPPEYRHYGWLILIIVFAASCLLGFWLQKRKKNKKKNKDNADSNSEDSSTAGE